MEKKQIEIIAHVPVEAFGFFEMRGGEDDMDKLKEFYSHFSSGLRVNIDGFEQVKTFTGETILYNKETHQYKDLEGNELISGSTFAKSKEKPFQMDFLSAKTASKYGYTPEEIKAVWKDNGECSAQFGTTLHKAMENFFRHKHIKTGDKKYYLPKPKFLLDAVESFPNIESEATIPEIFVSDVANRRCGQIDLLEIVSIDQKIGIIWDYKSDIELTKDKMEKYSWQLSYYAEILESAGWTIIALNAANYVNKWEIHELERKEI